MNINHALDRPAGLNDGRDATRCRRALRSGLILAASIGLFPVVAAGQEGAGRVQLGPLGLAPTVAISSVGVDDNVFNEAGDRKRDFTATFAPQVDAWLQLGRARLTGSSRLNVRYFKEYSNQGGTSTGNDLRLDVVSARFSPYVSGAFENSYDRANLEIDTRTHHQGSNLRAGSIVQFSGKLSFDLSAERRGSSFDEGEQFRDLSLREQLNRTVKRFGGNVRYELTPLTRMTVAVDREATSFEVSPERDSTGIRILTGLEFKPLALVSGTARLGMLRYRPVGGPPVTLGPIAAVELGYTLFGATRFVVRVNRDLGYSVDDLETYYLQTGASLSVTRQLDEHWDVGGNAGRQRLGTHTTIAGALPGNGLRTIGAQNVLQFGATVGYRVSRQLRFGVNADRAQRSGVPSEEYGNLRVFGTLLYSIF